ncbi:hypothetical protein SAMN05661008_00044 [Alkalithermobacter thermoalcaliphilus JW-YL-7 = DSM 7308]|uniref:DUF4367 domain-containing protein n=1 Tax=Alkalithermobacter thermoalcaliphilus JW-YL-7 = DSM 7308 TaxID=1121328 RepID=A0A150FS32_CLOPD|nr:hypothetical protein JWYL7_1477 [[Clostridium] paradoxum JW-YL-7 = DSM 7308]SHK34133.1 hypothetical protein SAMN05661008_00044 [[Clostridium] paradoxum JW-YL-7 = DSM 7308]
MNEKYDEKIKQSLILNTDEAKQLKDIIWKDIEMKINTEKDNSIRKETNIFKNIKLLAIAASISIIFLLNTNYGQAAIDKIKEIFVQEKNNIELIEGIKEKNKVDLQTGQLGYVIYFDKEEYILENNNQKDKIIPKIQSNSSNLPEIFMEISRIKDKSPDEVSLDIYQTLKGKYNILNAPEKITTPINGLFIYASSGYNWDDTVLKFYVISDQKGGTFLIKQQLFLEASEGYGVRFDNMLKDFHIVN